MKKTAPVIIILKKKFVNKKYLSWLNNKSNRKKIDLKQKITLDDLMQNFIKGKKIGQKLHGIFFKNQHIGNINIKFFKKRKAYIGYLIGDKNFRSKGLATYAVNLAAEKCFKKYKISKIFSNSQASNTSSIKVLEKNNFSLLKSRPKIFPKYIKQKIKVKYYVLEKKNFVKRIFD